MNIDKYLITEGTYRMKQYKKYRTITKKGSRIHAILKTNKSDVDIFKNQKEFEDYVENSWTEPKGGAQSSQF